LVSYICEGCAKVNISEEQYEKQRAFCDECYKKYLHISIPHIKKKDKKVQFIARLKELQKKRTKQATTINKTIK
jgi:hypothetical protein